MYHITCRDGIGCAKGASKQLDLSLSLSLSFSPSATACVHTAVARLRGKRMHVSGGLVRNREQMNRWTFFSTHGIVPRGLEDAGENKTTSQPA